MYETLHHLKADHRPMMKVIHGFLSTSTKNMVWHTHGYSLRHFLFHRRQVLWENKRILQRNSFRSCVAIPTINWEELWKSRGISFWILKEVDKEKSCEGWNKEWKLEYDWDKDAYYFVFSHVIYANALNWISRKVHSTDCMEYEQYH